MKQEPLSPRLRFFKRVLLFALLHYAVLLAFAGLIFLVSHIPPKAVNLDTIIEALVAVENVLVAPRKLLLWLWPWEFTPGALGPTLTVINSLTWGTALAAARTVWQKATT